MIKKFIKRLLETDNIIRFELDVWYKWYEEPQKFHYAVVSHLEKEGRKVETISMFKM
ncbi:hypothetical protein [Aquibacillus rhizosphaerae]|uniref:Uncharacterized protein n=1 Tax=Aquibacillus rhizosphaerae TaxID=3051431 RepID=A0ABT7L0B6_9BACI|nr:hypothetical protein [Aquibacillus sp. LR5S19]MDL4839262.1 hypothetical protein [Aquibacillus sp. LR5S19]